MEEVSEGPAVSRLAELELSSAGEAVIEALGVETVEELTALKESDYVAAANRVDETATRGALWEIKQLLADMGEHFAPEGELVQREGPRPARTAVGDGLVEHRDADGRYRVLLLDEPARDQGHFPDATMWSWRHGDVDLSVQVRPAPASVDSERLTGIQYRDATLVRGDWGMFASGRTDRSCFANLYDSELGLIAFAAARGREEAEPSAADCSLIERLAHSLGPSEAPSR